MIRMILNAKSQTLHEQNIFWLSTHMFRGSKSVYIFKMSRYQSLCVIHKYLDSSQRIFCFMFVKVILRNAKGIRSCIKRVFVRILMPGLRTTPTSEVDVLTSTCTSLDFPKALHIFRDIIQNIFRAFWIKPSFVPQTYFISTSNVFQIIFCQWPSTVLNCIKK